MERDDGPALPRAARERGRRPGGVGRPAGVVGRLAPGSPETGLIDWVRRDGRDVRRWRRPEDGLDVTLVGPAAASGVPPGELAAWMGEAVAGPGRRLDRLRRVLNYWVLIVEDPSRGAVHVATDPLGIYPLFLTRDVLHPSFGCDVWEMRDAGLIVDGSINHPAVAAWLVYSYDYSCGSIFQASTNVRPCCSSVV
ncbi:MAG: hypothetical protein ACODAA_07250, partial [Gemmatimonadota bacterium]